MISRIIFLITTIVFSGCSTLSTPMLKHETGEALGQKKFRVRAQLESSRLFPLLPAALAQSASKLEQEASVFRGGFFGIFAAVGVLPKLDLQLGTYYTTTGGGWRFGSKYELWRLGGFAFAAMAGYGRFAAEGTQTYVTKTGNSEVKQIFSAGNMDLSFPVSYRVNPSFAVYTGLNYYRTSISGAANLNTVTDTANDIGTNFGIKLNFGKFETDIEFAYVRIFDTISSESRFVPYYGVSAGITF